MSGTVNQFVGKMRFLTPH